MKKLLIISLLAFNGALYSPLSPANQNKVEGLIHVLPDGWVEGFTAREGAMVMKEFVPKGETVHDWSEMMTTQTFLGGSSIVAKQFQSRMKVLWINACPGSSVVSIRDRAYARG